MWLFHRISRNSAAVFRGGSLLILCFASIAAHSGCDLTIGTDPSKGELGRAEFAWDRGALGCLFGCDADEPMADQSLAVLWVKNFDTLPAFTVASDDPTAIEFSQADEGGAYVRCEAQSTGTAKLVLTDAVTGEEIDRFAIDVHATDAVIVHDDDLTDGTLIMVGGSQQIGIDLLDDDDEELVGVGGVEYAFTGGVGEEPVTLVSALADAIASIFAGTVDEYVHVEAIELGEGSLVATAPSGASFSLPVGVVDASAVTRIEIEAPPITAVGEAGGTNALAYAGDDRVYSPACEWTVDPAEGVVEVDSHRDSVSFHGVAPGRAVLTCTVGSAQDSVDIVVE